MIKNYLKIALRNIRKHKRYSFINIISLAIGIACAMLIFLWIQDEWSYNRFHKNSDRICRVIGNYEGSLIPASPGPFAKFFREEIPEIANATRFYSSSDVYKYNGKSLHASGLLVEPEFFEILNFPFIQGDPQTALTNISNIVITEETARKFFGNEDPIGKLLQDPYGRYSQVTGVIKNVPHNSSLKFDYLASFDICRFWKKPDNWYSSQDYQTYVLLGENISFDSANKKLNELSEKYFAEYNQSYFFQPLTKLHLYSNYKFDLPHGNIYYVYIFTFIAIFILLIACINFMNLSTSRFTNRIKEIGLRKVIGADRFQLIQQFFGESILFACIALPIALLIIEFSVPYFNSLSGKDLIFHYLDYRFILSLVSLVVLLGIISGSYPALFLSSFQPVRILRGNVNIGLKSSSMRRALVVIQFSFAILAIVGSLVVLNQIRYIRNKNLGFDKENLVYAPTSGNFDNNYQAFKNDLLKYPDIVSITASDNLPTAFGHTTSVDWEGKSSDVHQIFQIHGISYDYLKTYDMNLAQGRTFSKEFSTDIGEAFVINETAAHVMNMKKPIGTKIAVKGKDGEVIGIVKDFHFKSLHEKIDPLILKLGTLDREHNYVTIRINTIQLHDTITLLEQAWKKYSPNYPFELHFLDDQLDKLYTNEQRLGKIMSLFTFFMIFISCLGLYGLSTFVTQKRIKEIGVRKVLGASVPDIVYMLSKEFTKWVLLANFFSWPVAYYAMNKWLQNFVYRINMSWWTFVLAGALALVIALLTVSYQAIRSATTNPVEALKYE